tara:strand:- start:1066 stop:1539 length:474 start_codon:yes stop_codon:yes gene_type:complete
MSKKKNTFLIIIFLFLYQCGFKLVNYSELNNFKIEKIITEGENKINYKLKNYIQVISNNNSDTKIVLNLKSESKSSIKEKNSSNEVTKYQLEITTIINLRDLNTNRTDKFEFLVNGDYLVANKYSETLKNQEQLIENLTRKLSSEIKRELSQRLNDS